MFGDRRISELEETSQLRVLDLSWNMIRENDIRPLSSSLKVNFENVVPVMKIVAILIVDQRNTGTAGSDDEWIE